MDYLPIFLRIQGQSAVVVGGGAVAARKVELLSRTGPRITVVAPQLGPALQALARSGAVQHIAAAFDPSHVRHAAIVIAATGLAEVNQSVAAAARAQRIPVNVVDDPDASSFIFPAIIDRSPILVAVSSSGRAPVLARFIREQIEALLPAGLGRMARFMGERRKAVQRALAVSARRAFWERVVRGAVGLRLLAGDRVGADQAFERDLRTAQMISSRGTGGRGLGVCYLIGAGPGDPDLLTLRALQLLQSADVILYDRLVPQSILERARRDAERVFVGKQPGDQRTTEPGEPTPQERINSLLVDYARRGLRVARLKGGDPFVFGRGGEEIEVLNAHGIPFIVVPGITAALGAAASACIPLTHRRLSQSVTLVAGQVLDDETVDWRSLTGSGRTLVIYMGVSQLPRIVARLRAVGASADLPVAIIERATLPEERTLRGNLESIAGICSAANVTAPALLIVGDVTALAAAGVLDEEPSGMHFAA